MYIVIILLSLVVSVRPDFECLCNYNIELPVFQEHTPNSTKIGTLYEFDCKPTSPHGSGETTYKAIQFEQQLGFVHLDENIQIQICAGDPSPFDIVTTVATTTVVTTTIPSTVMSTTIPTTLPTTVTTSTTTQSTTTTSTTLPTTTTRTTTIPTTSATTPTSTSTATTQTSALSTTPKIIEGHADLCPSHVKTDAHLKKGFLGQYGELCYEFVSWKRAFDGAQSHCKTESGTLVSISSQQEQNYLERFLASHHVVEKAWIGLNDKQSEGVLSWTSGVPVTYTNFQTGYNQHSTFNHKNNDCFVITSGGEWVDQPCGVALSIINIGETHPFICQYNISAKLGTFFDILPGAISVG